MPSIQFDLILSSKRKFSSKEWAHRLMKTSLSMQEEIEWVGGWKKHWTLEITFYVEMVWSINCDEQSLIWQYRNCWNDVFRICIKCHDIFLLHEFEKEFLVYIWRSTKWKFGIVLSFQNMTNTNYTHARSPQQLSFSMHWANDVCRLGSFRFLFKSHLDIIILLAIYSGKLNRKRKNSFS